MTVLIVFGGFMFVLLVLAVVSHGAIEGREVDEERIKHRDRPPLNRPYY